MLAKPHWTAGSEFKLRKMCDGPVGELTAEEQELWSNSMVFKCIYRCGDSAIPYAEFEEHTRTCKFRPRFCMNVCGDFRLHDPESTSDEPPYTCEKCLLKSVPQPVKLTGDKLGTKFQRIKQRQEDAYE